MTEKPSASDLAREGLELWDAGDLESAETKYRQALELIPEEHCARPHVRAQLASVLAARGMNEEARIQYEPTLKEELIHAEGAVDHPAGQSLIPTPQPPIPARRHIEAASL